MFNGKLMQENEVHLKNIETLANKIDKYKNNTKLETEHKIAFIEMKANEEIKKIKAENIKLKELVTLRDNKIKYLMTITNSSLKENNSPRKYTEGTQTNCNDIIKSRAICKMKDIQIKQLMTLIPDKDKAKECLISSSENLLKSLEDNEFKHQCIVMDNVKSFKAKSLNLTTPNSESHNSMQSELRVCSCRQLEQKTTLDAPEIKERIDPYNPKEKTKESKEAEDEVNSLKPQMSPLIENDNTKQCIDVIEQVSEEHERALKELYKILKKEFIKDKKGGDIKDLLLNELKSAKDINNSIGELINPSSTNRHINELCKEFYAKDDCCTIEELTKVIEVKNKIFKKILTFSEVLSCESKEAWASAEQSSIELNTLEEKNMHPNIKELLAQKDKSIELLELEIEKLEQHIQAKEDEMVVWSKRYEDISKELFEFKCELDRQSHTTKAELEEAKKKLKEKEEEVVGLVAHNKVLQDQYNKLQAETKKQHEIDTNLIQELNNKIKTFLTEAKEYRENNEESINRLKELKNKLKDCYNQVNNISYSKKSEEVEDEFTLVNRIKEKLIANKYTIKSLQDAINTLQAERQQLIKPTDVQSRITGLKYRDWFNSIQEPMSILFSIVNDTTLPTIKLTLNQITDTIQRASELIRQLQERENKDLEITKARIEEYNVRKAEMEKSMSIESIQLENKLKQVKKNLEEAFEEIRRLKDENERLELLLRRRHEDHNKLYEKGKYVNEY